MINSIKNKTTFENILFCLIVMLPQFFVFPLFLNSNIMPKTIVFCLIVLLVSIFVNYRVVNVSLADLIFLSLITFILIQSCFLRIYSLGLLIVTLLLCLVLFKIFLDNCSSGITPHFVFFLRLLTVLSLAVSLLGHYEFFSFSLLGKSDGPLIPYILPPNISSRIGGVYGQPNFTALLLLIGLVSYVYCYLFDKQYVTLKLSGFKYIPFFVISVAFFLTGSRGGLLAFFLTFSALLCATFNNAALRESRKRFLFLLSILLLGLVFSFLLNDFFAAKAMRGVGSTGIPTDSRFFFWTAAFLIFLDSPLWGIGVDNFKFYLPKYAEDSYNALGFIEYEAMGYTKWAHSELFQLLCEGGALVFIACIALILIYLSVLFKCIRAKDGWGSLKVYSHVLILPFIVQSCFSWQLRFAPLLVIFSVIVVFVSSYYSHKIFYLNKASLLLIKIFSFCLLICCFYFSSKEISMGAARDDFKSGLVANSFSKFESLSNSFYSDFEVLYHFTPRFIDYSVKNKDQEVAEKIIPYISHLTEIQGTHWQWFYRSHAHFLAKQYDSAKNSVERAIDLYPAEEPYWKFLHYINVVNASRETGRPIEDFLPEQQEQAIDFEPLLSF